MHCLCQTSTSVALTCRGIQETFGLTYKRIPLQPVSIQALVERKRIWVEVVGKWAGIMDSWRNELMQVSSNSHSTAGGLTCFFLWSVLVFVSPPAVPASVSSFQNFCVHLITVSLGLSREAVDHTVSFNPKLRQFSVGSLLAVCVAHSLYCSPFILLFNFSFTWSSPPWSHEL